MRAFFLFGALGILSGGLAGGAVAWRARVAERAAVPHGWEPHPVLVVAREVRANEVLTADALETLTIPARFFSASMVPASDRDLVVGQVTAFALGKGDPLLWWHFASPKALALESACEAAIRAPVQAAGDQARQEVLNAFEREAARTPFATLPGLPNGPTIEVVVASRERPGGVVLAREDLALATLPASLVTQSLVTKADLPALVGAALMEPVLQGDPLLWQMLDEPEHPRLAWNCARLASSRRTEALERAAREQAHLLAEKGPR